MGLAGYLIVPHLGLMRGEVLGGAACGGGGTFNCHIVTGSPWGTVLGMPLALWGLIGYLAIFGLSLLAWQSPEWAAHAQTLISLLALVFVAIDLFLFSVMAFAIRSFCPLCLATYAINLTLLMVSARSLGRPWPAAIRSMGGSLAALVPSAQRPAAWLFWGIMMTGLSGSLGLHAATTFVSRGSLTSVQPQLREYLLKQPRVQVSVTGDPTHGPAGAAVQLIEFSDFLCPACQRASKLNKIILANHRDDVEFVFKSYPLDTSCNDKITRMAHAGACAMAAAGECAQLQGKFWPVHDLFFEATDPYNPAHLEGDLRRLGLDVVRFQACMASGEGMEAVKRDIAAAGAVGVMSTPTYVINGVPLPGMITPATFEDLTHVLEDAASSSR